MSKCEQCGVEFVQVRSDQRFCGASCRQASFKRKNYPLPEKVTDKVTDNKIRELEEMIRKQNEEIIRINKKIKDLENHNTIFNEMYHKDIGHINRNFTIADKRISYCERRA